MDYNDKIRNEAMCRLELLHGQGLDPAVVEGYKTGKRYFARKVADNAVLHYEISQEAKVSRAVEKIEAEYHAHVYYAVYNETVWGLLVTMLAVDMDYPEEWEDERAQMGEQWATGYAYDVSHDFSEVGSMPYQILDHALIRKG
ncbi:hypothetical protein [Anaeromassilibacillus sp. An200]|uniref:hypothetical protein n=1 Tax=Anaeromassilibacillus sp. An200 TaxID=1965587 RepID=UPI000B3A72F9|nr:hypothetical protein [Anaeromassilibacillus sp. An200]OUP06421.1 hypothetical protein B5F35_15415 [Anaeromassilibacillus sp. An200]